jgi:3-oxoacyl-(acyl-carrier-protein) synthase
MRSSVAVCGVGAICTTGYGIASLYDAVIAGRVADESTTEWSEYVPRGQPLGAVDGFDPATWVRIRGMRPLSRASRMAVIAAASALGFPDKLREEPAIAGVVVGSRRGSLESIVEFNRDEYTLGPAMVNPAQFPNVVANVHAGYLGIFFGLTGPNLTICGSAAGLEAIGQAVDQIRLGRASRMLAGGVEALGGSLLRGYAQSGAFDRGVVPGEGAAFVVLDANPAPEMPVLARIAGHATVTAYRGGDVPGALDKAIHHALDEAGVAVQSVTDVWLAGEGAGESLSPIGLAHASIHSIRRTTGDCEAADGALCAALAFHQVSNGGGPALVLNAPPSGNQVAVVVVPPDW